jgi:hypothetical protein
MSKSFLDLPPEVRIQIYRLLLSRDSTIDFEIYLNCRAIIARRAEQHWIYPAILACCRLTNNEGTPILYGENMFEAVNEIEEVQKAPWNYLPIWRISEVNIGRIARIRLDTFDLSDVFMALNTLDGLQEIDVVHCCPRAKDWSDFIRAVSSKLGNINRATFRIECIMLLQMQSDERPSGREGFLKEFSDVLSEPGIFAGHGKVHLEQKESPEIHESWVSWVGSMLLTVERSQTPQRLPISRQWQAPSSHDDLRSTQIHR